jgi:hypothetical protein
MPKPKKTKRERQAKIKALIARLIASTNPIVPMKGAGKNGSR